MPTESPIYAKIEHNDAVFVKKDILSSEIHLLNTLKNIQEFKKLRKKENILKLKLKKLISQTKKSLRETVASMPKTENIEKQRQEKKQKTQEKKVSHSIENQLDQIQRELKALS